MSIEVNEFDAQYGQPVEPGDRIWVRVMASRFQALEILSYLIEKGVSFTYDPFPGIEHQITVKADAERTLREALER